MSGVASHERLRCRVARTAPSATARIHEESRRGARVEAILGFARTTKGAGFMDLSGAKPTRISRHLLAEYDHGFIVDTPVT
jgi:hypothetical protein